MSGCSHPKDSQRFWTINDPLVDDSECVFYWDGSPVYQTKVVGMCTGCGEPTPEKVLKTYQVNYDKLKLREDA